MRTFLSILTGVLLISGFARDAAGGGGGPVPGKGAPPADVAALADAERAFAATAAARGVRDAFLEHLASDAILLRPGPVNAHTFMGARPNNPGPLLAWEPSYVELSASGELGWDTGPWSYRSDRAKDPVAWGHFATVWRKDKDGRWRAILDHGHDMTTAGPPEPFFWARASAAGAIKAGGAAAKGAGDPSADLTAADRAYGAALAKGGLAAALADYGAPDVRVYREGQAPVLGTLAPVVFPQEWKGGVTSTDAHTGVISKAGDLGYTYGTIALADTSVSRYGRNFMRVWRKSGPEGWRIALDVVNEIPPPPAPAVK